MSLTIEVKQYGYMSDRLNAFTLRRVGKGGKMVKKKQMPHVPVIPQDAKKSSILKRDKRTHEVVKEIFTYRWNVRSLSDLRYV